MELIKEKIEEGLAYAKQIIASMEEVDLDDLAGDAAFREQYAEAETIVIKMLAILAEAKSTSDQRSAISARRCNCSSSGTTDALTISSEIFSRVGRNRRTRPVR